MPDLSPLLASWPAGEGEMARRIRAHDWVATPLGPVEGWPWSLRTAVDMVLAMPGPANILWGPAHVHLYNDAYVAIAKDRHPALLGRPAAQGWPEVHAEVLAPVMDAAFAGRATRLADLSVTLRGPDARPEERAFDSTWSPIRDASGAVGGALEILVEVTERKRTQAALRESEERRAFLLALGDALRPLADPVEVQDVAMRLLGERLALGRAFYLRAERDETGWVHVVESDCHRAPGTASVVGRHRLAAFGGSVFEGMERGKLVVVPDVDALPGLTPGERGSYAAFGLRAFVNVPLVKNGEYVAAVCVHDAAPRRWTGAEIELVREVAERTWAAVERARAEAALRESEARFRALVTAGTSMVYRMSPDWRHMYQLSGRGVLTDTAEPVEDWADVFLLPEDRPRLFAAIGDAIRTRSPFELEHRVRRADGGVGWVLSRAVPIFGPEGEPVEWFGAGTDVTGRRLAQERLREGEARLRLALDAAEMGSFAWFPGEDRTEPDARTLALFGMARPGEMTLRRVLDLLHPEDREGHAARVARALDPSGEGALRSEVRVAHPDGTWRRLALAGQTRFDARGRAASMTGTVRDVTEAKAVEAALREREERNAFLLALGDAMRARSGANAMIEVAARLLGERLNASRIMFAEFDEARGIADIFYGWFADGAEPFPAVMRLADYDGPILKDLRAGRTVRIEDAGDPSFERPDLAAIAEVGVKALLSVPLIVGGRLAVNLSVHQHAARRWTDGEVALVREVAERLWADLVRARAEAALRGSEERFRALAEAIEDVFYMTDLDRGALLYLSPSYERVWGRPTSELLADLSGFEATLHPDDRPVFEAAKAAQARGEPVAAEYRVLRPDGTVRWVLDRSFPVPGGPGRRAAGTASDVTARKQAEAALRESEARFREFADASSDVLWIRDAGTLCFEYVSPAFGAIYGEGFERVFGGDDLRRWAELVLPEDRGRVFDAFRRVRAGERVTHEFRIRRPRDGEVRWIRDTDFPLLDEAGRVRRVAGVGSDVTETKRAARRQEVLVAELQHRGRNLLGVVRSLASKTVGRGGPVEGFEDRLAALGRAQGQLSRAGGDRVELEALVRAELEAHADVEPPKVVVRGPRVVLSVEQVQTFALALHELATNAVKYGALKEADGTGRLAVTWTVADGADGGGGDGASRLVLDWVESGVDVRPDEVTRRGYGGELIEHALPYSLKAKTEYALGRDGVRCRVEMPLARHG